MNKQSRWEIVPHNECFSPSNLAGFVFAPNKLARDKYNAGLYFEISSSTFLHQPLESKVTSCSAPASLF